MGSEWTKVSIESIQANEKGAIAIGPFGSRLKSDNYVESGVPVIRGTNVTGGPTFEGDFVYITEEKADTLGSCNVYKNELVFPHRGSIGEVGIIKEDNRYVLSSSLMKLKVDEEQVDPLFIYYFFKSTTGKHELLKNASQVGTPGIGQPLTSLKKIEFHKPSLFQQKKIANILASIDEKIALNRQINQTLEQMAQTLFKSWFVDYDPVIDNALDAGSDIPEVFETRVERRKAVRESADFKPLPDDVRQLFPSQFEESELGWVPKGWKIETLSEVAEAIIDHRGKTPKKLGGDWAEEGTPALSAKNIKAGKVVRHDTIRYVDDELFNKWMKVPLKPQDILMTSEAPMGEMLYLAKESNYLLSQRLYGIRTNKELITGSYLYNWLQTTIAKADLEGRATGTTVVGIRQAELKKVAVLCPDIRISQAYSYHADSLYLKVEENSLQSLQLEKLRDILLPKLISGELRLDSPEVEQAKALVE